ncbi:hypothetical protein [Streptomyces sp. NPDC096193]|uniref:hypothetical protein n=1 Tax=Streptomyces sp. NPDC096193 TaxID=3155821 RepID=UPI003324936E
MNPPASDQHYRYIGEWVGTKLRWSAPVDQEELRALEVYGEADFVIRPNSQPRQVTR